MTASVLKALHDKRQEHAGRSRSATNPKKNVISSNGDNMANSAPLHGITAPVSPGDALNDSHRNASSSSSSSSMIRSSSSSASSVSPVASPGLPPIPAAPKASSSLSLLPRKKRHSLNLRSRSTSRSDSHARSSPAEMSTGSQAGPISIDSPQSPPAPPVLHRFPSRVELRAQYDRYGRPVRAVEEFYDQNATMPCLAYGTPPGPVGSDAFGRPPPYM